MLRAFHSELRFISSFIGRESFPKMFLASERVYFVSMDENQSLVNNICLVRNNCVLAGNITFPMPKMKSILHPFWNSVAITEGIWSIFTKLLSRYTLYSKFVKLVWFDQENKVFKVLKKKVTQAPILSFPDFSSPFSLCTMLMEMLHVSI